MRTQASNIKGGIYCTLAAPSGGSVLRGTRRGRQRLLAVLLSVRSCGRKFIVIRALCNRTTQVEKLALPKHGKD